MAKKKKKQKSDGVENNNFEETNMEETLINEAPPVKEKLKLSRGRLGSERQNVQLKK
jgi:hypothetical protein